ncbi:Hypothetical predicted protein [Lecanosticta acicola]|uniref:Uncharacterized protein n=1 Tax=Lecanosticta acicola TaxID=111012 RepID=A0AAI8YT75_9PEZI|nr:Hypothetical predicted protein [Lecanosticta acicola]
MQPMAMETAIAKARQLRAEIACRHAEIESLRASQQKTEQSIQEAEADASHLNDQLLEIIWRTEGLPNYGDVTVASDRAWHGEFTEEQLAMGDAHSKADFQVEGEKHRAHYDESTDETTDEDLEVPSSSEDPDTDPGYDASDEESLCDFCARGAEKEPAVASSDSDDDEQASDDAESDVSSEDGWGAFYARGREDASSASEHEASTLSDEESDPPTPAPHLPSGFNTIPIYTDPENPSYNPETTTNRVDRSQLRRPTPHDLTPAPADLDPIGNSENIAPGQSVADFQRGVTERVWRRAWRDWGRRQIRGVNRIEGVQLLPIVNGQRPGRKPRPAAPREEIPRVRILEDWEVEARQARGWESEWDDD